MTKRGNGGNDKTGKSIEQNLRAANIDARQFSEDCASSKIAGSKEPIFPAALAMEGGGEGSAEAPAVGGVEEEEHSESKERALQRYFLQEWKLVKSILDGIVAGGGVADYASVLKIRSILDKYQHQGQLLEPYLETIISPLMHIILAKTVELGTSSNEILEIMKPLCIVVYTLVTVCGSKSVLKFFPHQVSDLEITVSLLEKCHDVTTKTILRQESTGEMEMKCVILLWLSVLVLIPFDISSVDTSITTSINYKGEQEPPPLVLRLLGFSKDYLSSAGPMRRISSLLLSKLLTRPDMPKAFVSFNEWAHEVLSSATVNMDDQFRLLGVVEALAAIFKVGSRKYLLDFVNYIWADASSLVKSPIAARSSLLRKFLMKLAQRIGLVCLPRRPMTWHYVGRRSTFGESTICSDEDGHRLQSSSLGEEEIEVLEIIEELIEMLLTGLRDTDTVVRWSAAKGIGRIASCLTSTLSDDVLSSILELFSQCEGDSSWHGGCLALAELARRGLLLPSCFPKVIPLIIKALHYDVRRGPHSIGSHVRDAAAYVCWAFGRAYSHSDMKNVLEQIAPHLLTIACYDREVNCRRAAAAAFQENVGRQGNFPHGIEIVNTADYFSLSSRVNSYLNVAVSIGQYSEYLHLFVEELLCKKICHWDRGLRELAAQGLSSIAKYDIEYFSSVVLDRLIPCTLSTDLCMRHGATLALGELILTLCNLGVIFSTEKQKQISGVVPAIEKARLYRGKGGEIMRSSVSRLIECTAICSIHLPKKLKASLFDVLNENLKHPNAQIQISAVDALRHFFPTYLLESDLSAREKIVLNYLKLLADPNVAARRGSALAIGVLPVDFLACRWKDVLHKLCCCCLVEDDPNDRDAEARVNAVRGLSSVCKSLTKPREDDYVDLEGKTSLYLSIKNDVFHTFFKALDDYSVDNRGDVGSWVREAAMGGLESCTYILCDKGFVACTGGETHLLFDGSLATSLIGGLLKQAVEKMDKTRETAGKILCRILHNPMVSTLTVNHSDTLKEIFANDSNLEWGVPSVSYPRLVNLLQFDCYSKSLISGLVVSTGGLQSSLQKASIGAVLDYLRVSQNEKNGEKKELMLSEDLIWVLQQYRKCDRVIIPTLKTIEVLLSKRVFLSTENHCQDFASRILLCLEFEMKGSKEFSKLFTGISILGYLTSVPDPINIKAFSYLVSFLSHRYPKIRKATADQLYLVLVQNGFLIAEESIGKAFDLLLETCWDGDLQEAKNRTLVLYELAGINERYVKLTKENEIVKKGGKEKAPTDENESYSALVEDSGF